MSLKQSIQQEYADLFSLHQELLNLSAKYLETFELEHSAQCDVVMAILAKVTRSFRLVNTACAEGLGSEADPNCRAMFEDVMNLLFIMQDLEDDTLAKRYLHHATVQQFFMLESVKDNPEFTQQFPHERYEYVKAEKEKFYDTYDRPHKRYWSGLTFKDLCIRVGYEEYYDRYYSQVSQHPHAQSVVLGSYILEQNEERQTFGAGPQLENQESSLISAFEWFHKALSVTAIFMQNDEMIEELKDIKNRFNEVVTNNYV